MIVDTHMRLYNDERALLMGSFKSDKIELLLGNALVDVLEL
jgi:hypothetical protein